MTENKSIQLNPEGSLSSQIMLPQANECLEVTRNSKGYNWTCKILSTDLKRLKELTDELNKLYPLS